MHIKARRLTTPATARNAPYMGALRQVRGRTGRWLPAAATRSADGDARCVGVQHVDQHADVVAQALRHAEQQAGPSSQQGGDSADEEGGVDAADDAAHCAADCAADDAACGEDAAPLGGSGDDSQGSSDEEQEDLQVKLVTADFAMQNVALQMGMTLVAPDGVCIRQVNRYGNLFTTPLV